MNKQIILLLSLILLTSCATVNKTYTQSGEEAYSLNCSGTARGWDKCYKAAGDLCGTKGYTILDRTSEDTMHAQFNSYGFSASKSNERSMLIACKHN
jgi:hypothetical protein